MTLSVGNQQEEYWNARLTRAFGPAGTGLEAYGDPFNRWLYRVCAIRFRQVVQGLSLDLRGKNILDVGCGTGFYLEQWRRLGAEHLTGMDVAEVAIDRLGATDGDARLVHADISARPNPLQAESFDVVSAFAVLFHIVDEDRYRRALGNIYAALVGGGYLIFSDNFVQFRRPPMGDYHISRTREEIERALAETGFSIVARVPQFVLFGDPVDSESRWLRSHWRILSRVVRRSHALGGILGGLLFPLEVILTRLLRESPTTEIMICQKAER